MIIRNSILLAIFGGASVLLGIVRDRLLATYVGVGSTLDVYNASFRIPDLIYGVFLAFITSATVVPFLTRENNTKGEHEAEKRFASLLFFFSITMIFLIIIVLITLPLYTKFLVPGFSQEQVSQFLITTRLLMFQPLLLGISSLISCFAQLKNEFIYYAIAPLGYSLGIIFGVMFLYSGFGVTGLVVGVLVGAVISLLIQSISMRRHNFRIRIRDVRAIYVHELVTFAFPRSFTNVVSQLRVVFLTAFATTLGPGVLSSFLFAQRVTDAVSQIISQSVTTASIPILSREHEDGKIQEHEALVYKYTVLLFSIAVVLGGIIYFSRHNIIHILYGQNNANLLIAQFLVGFLIALPFSMASAYVSIGFYSMKNTSKVFIGNLVGSIACISVCLMTRGSGVVSLSYGIITYFIVSFTLYVFLYKRANFLRGVE
jgi:putative peptidoglycan lipid II flippase